uniref:Uncharacterized protein n=1 Tax=Tanacetum cinerariifolium TaxID=118510 RepID=A0A699JD82_TANCI|nr:hypothetical protein [Tanacetum cinerariifolium]
MFHGNIMNATARSNVAHNFLKLKTGEIYSVKNFSVQPNKDGFHIFKDAPFIVEFDGGTSVRKAFVKSDGFIKYPFEWVKLENLKLINNKHMFGLFSSGPGQGHLISILQIPDRIYLSSSSSTLIMDDDSIPILNGMETSKPRLPADFSEAKASTLENLLMWGRNRKNDDEVADSGLPTAPSNIVGTTHTLELKARTYYEHATYKSFTCWKIVSAEEVGTRFL